MSGPSTPEGLRGTELEPWDRNESGERGDTVRSEACRSRDEASLQAQDGVYGADQRCFLSIAGDGTGGSQTIEKVSELTSGSRTGVAMAV